MRFIIELNTFKQLKLKFSELILLSKYIYIYVTNVLSMVLPNELASFTHFPLTVSILCAFMFSPDDMCQSVWVYVRF